MLGSFMEEMQITPEQFEVAVLAGKQNPGGTNLPLHQGLFQQACVQSSLIERRKNNS